MTDLPDHTITGNIVVITDVWSPELENKRDIAIYLPPSYNTTEKRYPVLYMHDAQNLFDEGMSFSGEWQVDENMELLAEQGVEAIVVGIPNRAEERMQECCPFACDDTPSFGDEYVRFIGETLKPMIDERFRTLPMSQTTGILGSSMGGLITLYAFFRYPEVFGIAGAMSPSLWFADRAIYPFIEATERAPGRKLHLDIGTEEGEDALADARRMRDLLLAEGYQVGQELLYMEDEGAMHTESAWAYRLQVALRFLLPRLS
ncbi:MAG: alpha/beta hydrolase [Ardenticatenales bacterium]|nr:alpha/beta hydrolase [Ardenticatenales bacterium]